MARENTVYLYGRIIEKPKIFVDGSTGEITSGQISLYTLRRSYATEELLLRGAIRTDTPCVFSRNAKLIRENMSDLNKGDMVLVKGSLCTQEVRKNFICPHCGHEMYKSEAVVVYVDPIHIMYIGSPETDEEGFELLKENDEVGNQVYLYGTLCRDPEFYRDESTHKVVCQFQVASNRKRRILEDGPDKRTDYPWVKTFGKLAESCHEALHVNSSIYINGAIETREVVQTVLCEECESEFERRSYATEIVPYSIEYIHDCNIPNSDEEGTENDREEYEEE